MGTTRLEITRGELVSFDIQRGNSLAGYARAPSAVLDRADLVSVRVENGALGHSAVRAGLNQDISISFRHGQLLELAKALTGLVQQIATEKIEALPEFVWMGNGAILG